MGPDYGHPLRLAYHVILFFVAVTAGIVVVAWSFRKMASDDGRLSYPGTHSLRGMMGMFGWIFGWTAIFLLSWLLWDSVP